MHRLRALVGPLSLVLLIACSGGGAEIPVVSISDSAGVAVVRLESLERMTFPVWQSQVVYSTADLDSVLVGPFPQAVFTDDSSLVLADAGDLILIGPDGTLVQTLGRRGEGPGEFGQIGRVKLRADDVLVVSDLGSGRTTVMLSNGRYLRTIARLGRADYDREIDLVTALADGRVITTYWQERPNRGEIQGIKVGDVERDPVPLVVHDSMGERLGSLGLWLGLERADVPLQGGRARLPLPHARSVMYASRRDVTVISPTDSLDLSMYLGTALVVRMISPPTGQRRTREEAEAWRGALRDWNATLGPLVISALSTAAPDQVMPSIGPLYVDNQRNVWIGDYAAPGDSLRSWRVVSTTGIPIGIVELPAVIDPIVASRSEILDVYGGLLALLVYHDGEPVVEVRRIGP
jgi:hypothetical protein